MSSFGDNSKMESSPFENCVESELLELWLLVFESSWIGCSRLSFSRGDAVNGNKWDGMLRRGGQGDCPFIDHRGDC